MPSEISILRVFLASPGDVADERSLLEDVVAEINQTWGDRNGIMLKLLKWETDTYPGFGTDPQDVINKQIGDEYDIFIGLMWSRFGQPTSRAGSGTEEEFNRAFEKHRQSPDSIKLLFYFKNAGIPPSEVNAEQIQKVQNFKERMSKEYGGLYHEYVTTDQFCNSARIHLSKVVMEWKEANAHAIDGVEELSTSKAGASAEGPLANLQALEYEDCEEGTLDLIEIASDAMDEVGSIVERMSSATTELGKRFTVLTDDAKLVNVAGADIRAAKRVSNKAADELELFVQRMSVEIVAFNKHSGLAMDACGKVAMMQESDLRENPEDIALARESMEGYARQIAVSAQSLLEFRNSIFEMPRMTSNFKRARKRAVAVMDDLLGQLRIAESQTSDVEALLARLESR